MAAFRYLIRRSHLRAEAHQSIHYPYFLQNRRSITFTQRLPIFLADQIEARRNDLPNLRIVIEDDSKEKGLANRSVERAYFGFQIDVYMALNSDHLAQKQQGPTFSYWEKTHCDVYDRYSINSSTHPLSETTLSLRCVQDTGHLVPFSRPRHQTYRKVITANNKNKIRKRFIII